MSPYIWLVKHHKTKEIVSCLPPWLCITADFLAWMICQDVSENLKGYKDVSQWYLVVHDKMARILKVGVVLLISKWCFTASDLRHITPPPQVLWSNMPCGWNQTYYPQFIPLHYSRSKWDFLQILSSRKLKWLPLPATWVTWMWKSAWNILPPQIVSSYYTNLIIPKFGNQISNY